MQINAITCDEMMKKGLCFICKEPGHRSFECKNQRVKDGSFKKKTPFQKNDKGKGREIRTIEPPKAIDEMTQEELAKFVTKQDKYIKKITADAMDMMKGQSFGSPRQ
jgi:hypothetical protein